MKKVKFLRMIAAAVISFILLPGAIDAPYVCAAGKKLSQSDFVHTQGRNIIGTDGKTIEIRGMALGNCVYDNPSSPPSNHHSEKAYKELSEMGFNCVRFYLNYGIFESDSKPYEYKKSGIEWLDKNVKWAKKYGMGIIFNMHCPQGGYQSQGNGTELWTDKNNQDRLAALWRFIASRYANETAVWGYGLINEPVVPLKDDKDETAEQYFSLVRRLTEEIRSVSPYQMIFAERLCAAKDISSGKPADWNLFDLENSFPETGDSNTVYEFHFYTPHKFTHQYAEWTGNGGKNASYPSDELTEIIYENSWTGFEKAKKKSEHDGWSYFESDPVSSNNKRNIAVAALNVNGIGNGEAYFDDIVITEISASGSSTIKYSYDFSASAGEFYPWSSDGTGSIEFCGDDGHSEKGCAMISGAKSDFTASASGIAMKKDCKYVISGYIKSGSENACIRLDFAKAKEVIAVDADYLEKEIKPYADFSEKRNVPVYMGEFGVIRYGFEENRNGVGWVSDVIDICRKYNIGFNYHTYHETSFGLYGNDQNKSPSELNKELAALFVQKLKGR